MYANVHDQVEEMPTQADERYVKSIEIERLSKFIDSQILLCRSRVLSLKTNLASLIAALVVLHSGIIHSYCFAYTRLVSNVVLFFAAVV